MEGHSERHQPAHFAVVLLLRFFISSLQDELRSFPRLLPFVPIFAFDLAKVIETVVRHAPSLPSSLSSSSSSTLAYRQSSAPTATEVTLVSFSSSSFQSTSQSASSPSSLSSSPSSSSLSSSFDSSFSAPPTLSMGGVACDHLRPPGSGLPSSIRARLQVSDAVMMMFGFESEGLGGHKRRAT